MPPMAAAQRLLRAGRSAVKYIRKNQRGHYFLDDYLQYLSEHAERFPLEAIEFAKASWHYDFKDRHALMIVG
jgi:hypothetical protein